MKTQLFTFVLLLFIFISCQQRSEIEGPVYELNKALTAKQGMVISAHPVASEIGLEILKKGGNAVDAAIAVQFALDVCYPVAGNIGGGGFMVFRDKEGEVYTLDFREKAPLAATEDMYLDENGDAIMEKSRLGHLAVGVPGSVDGMVKAFERFSKLNDWKALVQPSVEIAKDGFQLTERQAKNLNGTKDRFKKANTIYNQFMKPAEWKKGELLVQKDLAKVFEAIRDQGRNGFYKGWVADSLVEEMERGGGIIRHEDLETYESQWRDPIIGEYKDFRVYSMPPPSSGGILLVQMLEMLEDFPLNKYGFHSKESIHLIAESERRAYADRATHLGDSDYFPVPVAQLIDPEYARARMEDFNPEKASKSEEVDAGNFMESEQTTHFSIIDAEGNAVSVTTTLNGGYGSKVIAGGTGIFLNNEMDDFSTKPGTPNMFGLIGAEANKIEPGKRMLSSMTPTILEKNGNLFLIVGTPGGSTIITSVLQVCLNIIEFNMEVSDAVQSPRFHHQWLPDVLYTENEAFGDSLRVQLEQMGHTLQERGNIGRVEAIVVENETIYGAADRRGDDHAAGY